MVKITTPRRTRAIGTETPITIVRNFLCPVVEHNLEFLGNEVQVEHTRVMSQGNREPSVMNPNFWNALVVSRG